MDNKHKEDQYLVFKPHESYLHISTSLQKQLVVAVAGLPKNFLSFLVC